MLDVTAIIDTSKDKGTPKKPYMLCKMHSKFQEEKEVVIYFKNFPMHKLYSDEIKQFMEVIRKAENSLCNKS